MEFVKFNKTSKEQQRHKSSYSALLSRICFEQAQLLFPSRCFIRQKLSSIMTEACCVHYCTVSLRGRYMPFFYIFMSHPLSSLSLSYWRWIKERDKSSGSGIPRLPICPAQQLQWLDNTVLIPSTLHPPTPPSTPGCCALQTSAHGRATQESYLLPRLIPHSWPCLSGHVCMCVCVCSVHLPIYNIVFLYVSCLLKVCLQVSPSKSLESSHNFQLHQVVYSSLCLLYACWIASFFNVLVSITVNQPLCLSTHMCLPVLVSVFVLSYLSS